MLQGTGRNKGKLNCNTRTSENYDPTKHFVSKYSDYLTPSEVQEVVFRDNKTRLKGKKPEVSEQIFEDKTKKYRFDYQDSDSLIDGSSVIEQRTTTEEQSISCIVSPPEITPAPSSDYIPSNPTLAYPNFGKEQPELPVITHGNTRGTLTKLECLKKQYGRTFSSNINELPVITHGRTRGTLTKLERLKRKYGRKCLTSNFDDVEKKSAKVQKDMSGWFLSYLLSFWPFFGNNTRARRQSSVYDELDSITDSSRCTEFTEQEYAIVPALNTLKKKEFNEERSEIDSICWEELSNHSRNIIPSPKDDPDHSFLMSILPLMKQLTPKDNLEFRLEVQKSLKSKLFPVAEEVDVKTLLEKSSVSTKSVSRQLGSHQEMTCPHNSSQQSQSCPKAEMKPSSKSTKCPQIKHRRRHDTAI